MGYQRDIIDFFQARTEDNAAQQTLRSHYYNLCWTIENTSTQADAEKAVAKRKLLESLDAALRAAER